MCRGIIDKCYWGRKFWIKRCNIWPPSQFCIEVNYKLLFNRKWPKITQYFQNRKSPNKSRHIEEKRKKRNITKWEITVAHRWHFRFATTFWWLKKDEPFSSTVISSGNVFSTVITSVNLFPTVITSGNLFRQL